MGHGVDDFLLPIIIGRLSEQAIKKINPNVQLNEYRTEHSTTPQVKFFCNIKTISFN